MSLIIGKCQDIQWNMTPCFIILENSKGNILYISEVQHGVHSLVRFNDLPELLSHDVHIIIKLVGQLPFNYNDWVIMAQFSIFLNNLVWIGSDLLEQIDSQFINEPVLEFIDGYFSPKKLFKVEDNLVSDKICIERSVDFTSLLKLNKILEYLRQVKTETQEFSKRINLKLKIDDKQPATLLRKLVNKVTNDITEKKKMINYLQETVKNICLDDEVQSFQSNEKYETYSMYKQKNRTLLTIQKQKFSQLTSIFLEYKFLESWVTLSRDSDFPHFINLSIIDSKKIMSEKKSIEQISAMLGYYLLYIQILGSRIFSIPLPHKLSFFGGTSIINDSLPLYLIDPINQKHISNFLLAVHYFNLDILHIRQHLEFHY